MFDAKVLFKERLGNHIKLLNRYLRYLFNGHFMIAMLFLMITLLIYYQQWLETIPENFPAAIVIAIIFGLVVSYNPMQTFLKEPDEVFLIVKEKAMQPYFRYALIYNYVFQLYLVVVAFAAIGPLYSHMFPNYKGLDIILLIGLALVLKAWNLGINWMMYKVRNQKLVWMDKGIRLLASMAMFYFVIEQSLLFFVILFFYMMRVVNVFLLSMQHPGLKWDVLIDNDRHRLAMFYRFVSNFAEVPQLMKRIKKRRFLTNWAEKRIAFLQSATYTYLYRLTFIRSGDYLNLYVRLTVIGGIIMYVLPNSWLTIAIALLFLYMTSFQLIPMFHHHRISIWLDLYPVTKNVQRQSFLHDMRILAIMQAIIFALLFVAKLDWQGLGISVVVNGLFIYLFYKMYVRKKISM